MEAKKRIVHSIIILSSTLVLAILSIASYAWFSANKTVKAVATTISVKDPTKLSFSYDLYQYDSINDTVIHKTESDGTDFSLQAYDTAESESASVFNNIIKINVDLYNEEVGVKKTFKVDTECLATSIDLPYSGGGDEPAKRTYNDNSGYKYHFISSRTDGTVGDFICDNISNLIQFKFFVYSYKVGNTVYTPADNKSCLVDTNVVINTSTAKGIYDGASAIFAEITDKYTFVNGDSKKTKFVYSQTDIPGDADSMVFYIEYNYSSTLFEKYIKNNEYLKLREFDEFDITKLNLNVEFEKDIKSIKFDTEVVK